MEFIRCKKDYNMLIEWLTKTANEVNGTYEYIGVIKRALGTTDDVKEIFDISEEFEKEFVRAISTFEKKEIGPYQTDKYFLLIPALKEAMKQVVDDCVETRRCIIQFPPEHCFQSIQFFLRDNTVHVLCFMRSCDVIKNLPHDIWICSKLADMYKHYLNKMLNIKPYDYHVITMTFGSLHIYKSDIEKRGRHVL